MRGAQFDGVDRTSAIGSEDQDFDRFAAASKPARIATLVGRNDSRGGAEEVAVPDVRQGDLLDAVKEVDKRWRDRGIVTKFTEPEPCSPEPATTSLTPGG